MTEDIELVMIIIKSGNELGVIYNKYSGTYTVDGDDSRFPYSTFSSALLKRIAILIGGN